MQYANGTATEVQEVMQSDIVTVKACDTITDMLNRMQSAMVSALPVIDHAGKCVGIVSVTDIFRRVLSTEKLLQSEYPHFDDCLWAIDMVQDRFGNDKVDKLMSEVLATVSPDASMHKAACIMLNNHVHHLPVVGCHGNLVGMISSLDFVRLAASNSEE